MKGRGPRTAELSLEEREDRQHAAMILGGRRRSSLEKMLVTCFSTARSVTTALGDRLFERPSAISAEDLALARR